MTFSSRLFLLVALLATTLVAPPAAAQLSEPVDADANALIRKHGMERSEVAGTLHMMTDVFGGRLTGSAELDKATAWAAEMMEAMGLQNVKQEAWGPFGKGWSLNSFSMNAHTDAASFPIYAFPKAWSHGTNGMVSGEVVVIDPAATYTQDELSKLVEGKIAFISPQRELTERFEPIARRHDDETLLRMSNWAGSDAGGRGGRRFRRAGAAGGASVLATNALAIVDVSRLGDYGTIFVSGAAALPTPEGGRGSAYAMDAPATPPQVTMAPEHYNRIVRLVASGFPVSIDVSLDVAFKTDDPMEYNVIGEIPGTDPQIGDEVVMLGAHYDGWHAGTGSTDNASGSSVMVEAMRILTETFAEMGTSPRRTIRVALWTGEEQGLNGSRAYVSDHFAESEGRGRPITQVKPEHSKLSGYYNLDNGTGKIRGVYQQGNIDVAPIFKAWMRPFQDLGAGTLSLQNTGGTDHLSFDAVGLPGFQFIQEPMAYGTKTHHSNMDVYDHAVIDDLKQSATIIASFVYHTAMRDEQLPRKAMPPVETEAGATSSR
jgi:carboxypeptidase Q